MVKKIVETGAKIIKNLLETPSTTNAEKAANQAMGLLKGKHAVQGVDTSQTEMEVTNDFRQIWEWTHPNELTDGERRLLSLGRTAIQQYRDADSAAANILGASTKEEGKWEIYDKDWLVLKSKWFEGTYNRGGGRTDIWPTWRIPLLDLPTIVKDIPNFPPPPPEGPHVPPGIPIVPGEDPKILCKLGMCDVPPEEENPRYESMDICMAEQMEKGIPPAMAVGICLNRQKGLRITSKNGNGSSSKHR